MTEIMRHFVSRMLNGFADSATPIGVTAALVIAIWALVGVTFLRVETQTRDNDISSRLDNVSRRVDDVCARGDK